MYFQTAMGQCEGEGKKNIFCVWGDVGPMRGLEPISANEGLRKKTALYGANTHTDSMTESAQWGRFGENLVTFF